MGHCLFCPRGGRSVGSRRMAGVEAMDPSAEVYMLDPGTIIDGRYEITKKLGEGEFGAMYEAVDTTGLLKGRMCLKLESAFSPYQMLKTESSVLRGLQGRQHVCQMYACGRNNKFNFLLMSLVGPTLSILRKIAPNNKFTLSTAIKTTYHCSKAIQSLHQEGWMHRNINPSNFAIGTGPRENSFFIQDFGLCRKLKVNAGPEGQSAEVAGAEVRPTRAEPMLGCTMRYGSVNVHRMMQLGRHDDLISLIYILVEMVKGELPWTSIAENSEVYRSKMSTQRSLFNKLPDRLSTVYQYLHTLRYDADTVREYDLLDQLLLEIIFAMNYHSEIYDWQHPDFAETPPSANANTCACCPLPKLNFIPAPDDQAEQLPQSNYNQ